MVSTHLHWFMALHSKCSTRPSVVQHLSPHLSPPNTSKKPRCPVAPTSQAVMEEREARRTTLEHQDSTLKSDMHKAKSTGNIIASSATAGVSSSTAPGSQLMLTGPGTPHGGLAALAGPGLKGLKDSSSSSSVVANDDLLGG